MFNHHQKQTVFKNHILVKCPHCQNIKLIVDLVHRTAYCSRCFAKLEMYVGSTSGYETPFTAPPSFQDMIKLIQELGITEDDTNL